MTKTIEDPLEIAKRLYHYDKFADHRFQSVDDITDEDVRRFHELGYLAVDQLLSEEEVDLALKDIADVISGKIKGPKIQFMRGGGSLPPEDREMTVRKLHKFVDHTPALHHICHHPKVFKLLERIFGEKPRFMEDQALLKPPGVEAGVEKPWHQDMAYPNFSYTKMVCGVWVALDEATIDNGCMHIIPRSQRNGPVPHYAVRDWQLCDAVIDTEKDEVVPLKPGGILIFSGLLHHGTPPNLSSKRRRALQFHYGPESATKMTPQEYKCVFTNEMTKAEC